MRFYNNLPPGKFRTLEVQIEHLGAHFGIFKSFTEVSWTTKLKYRGSTLLFPKLRIYGWLATLNKFGDFGVLSLEITLSLPYV